MLWVFQCQLGYILFHYVIPWQSLHLLVGPAHLLRNKQYITWTSPWQLWETILTDLAGQPVVMSVDGAPLGNSTFYWGWHLCTQTHHHTQPLVTPWYTHHIYTANQLHITTPFNTETQPLTHNSRFLHYIYRPWLYHTLRWYSTNTVTSHTIRSLYKHINSPVECIHLPHYMGD